MRISSGSYKVLRWERMPRMLLRAFSGAFSCPSLRKGEGKWFQNKGHFSLRL